MTFDVQTFIEGVEINNENFPCISCKDESRLSVTIIIIIHISSISRFVKYWY